MSDEMNDDYEHLPWFQEAGVVVVVVLSFALTGGATWALVVWLPVQLSPLALVPSLLCFRYLAGKTWLEAGCLVVLFGAISVAVAMAIS